MKKWFMILSVSLLLAVTAACSNSEANGKGPADIPVQWVNAEVQSDQSKLLELLDEKSKALDKEDTADNTEEVHKYKLTEWKANEDKYFYEIVYEHPVEGGLVTEQMEVIRTEQGWKRTKYGDLNNFDKYVEGLSPEILREMNEE